MILEIEIPGVPMPKQSVRAHPVYNRNGEPVIYQDKRSGRKKVLIRHHQPKDITDREKTIAFMIQEQLPDGFLPFQGPVAINRLHYVFPPLSSFSQKKMSEIAAGKIHPKTTKPDITDNLAKMIFDCMEGIIYLNDSQVWSQADVRKYYGFRPGIYITIEGDK